MNEYVKGKQTYKQLSNIHGVSIRTIQNRIDAIEYNIKPSTIVHDNLIVLGMDTLYFGRNKGVMIFRDITNGKNLLWYFIQHETNELYYHGYMELKNKGYNIAAIVCDGRPGLMQSFDIPVQLCQFHQLLNIRKYLTNKPKLEAALELKKVASILCKTDKPSFEGSLKEWHLKWSHFLKEKTINPETKKKHYTHKKIRSAYNSLNRNLNYLFTYYDHPDLNIPNTNNSLEGTISNLKSKLIVHNGLTWNRKQKIISYILQK